MQYYGNEVWHMEQINIVSEHSKLRFKKKRKKNN